MPGLIRGVARTAVVVGTANAVSHKQHQRWAAKDQQAAQAAAYQQQMYAPPPQYAAPPPQYAAPPPPYAPPPQYASPPPAPVVEEGSTVAQINQLAALHAQGVLNDEEFAAAKAKALGI
jgi:Short C-terminal domain